MRIFIIIYYCDFFSRVYFCLRLRLLFLLLFWVGSQHDYFISRAHSRLEIRLDPVASFTFTNIVKKNMWRLEFRIFKCICVDFLICFAFLYIITIFVLFEEEKSNKKYTSIFYCCYCCWIQTTVNIRRFKNIISTKHTNKQLIKLST